MLLRGRRRLLSVSALAMFLCAAGSLVWGLWLPAVVEAPSWAATAPTLARQATAVSASRPALEHFAAWWDRPLRPPLFDPPPVVETPPAPPPPPPLAVRLVGTILEPGRPVAILVNAAGKIEMKSIGQTAGDPAQPAEILEVHRERVVVRYAGERRELTLESR